MKQGINLNSEEESQALTGVLKEKILSSEGTIHSRLSLSGAKGLSDSYVRVRALSISALESQGCGPFSGEIGLTSEEGGGPHRARSQDEDTE